MTVSVRMVLISGFQGPATTERNVDTTRLTFRSHAVPKRSRSRIHIAQLTKWRSAGRGCVWAGGMRHGRSRSERVPSTYRIVAPAKSSSSLFLLLLFNVRNDGYGLIESRAVKRCRRSPLPAQGRSVGRWVGGQAALGQRRWSIAMGWAAGRTIEEEQWH